MKLEQGFELSRDPSDYEATAHLRRRIDERPMVDYDIIGEAIEDGEVQRVESEGKDRHSAVLRYEWLQSTFEVVIGIEEPKVQTAVEIES
jgi:hypothetical protein